MSIKSEITRLQNAKTAIATAIKNKGVSVPTGTKLDEMGSLINNISTGITPSGTLNVTKVGTYDVTNYASATFSVSTETKTVTPTASSQSVTPSGGKYLSKVTVNAIPSSYIIPSGTMEITKNGTYNVSSYQSATVNVAGAGTGTTLISINNMSTPVIASYTFAGVKELSYVSYFSCKTVSTSAFAYCTNLQSATFPKCTTFSSHAFGSCTNLKIVTAPSTTYLGIRAFNECKNLETANFPLVKALENYTFYNCNNLKNVDFNRCSRIAMSAFYKCSSLEQLSMPITSIIHNGAFMGCIKLSALYIDTSTVPVLSNTNAFANTPIANSTYLGYYGSIYVRSSMLSSFKAATNWVTYSDRIVAY